MSITLSSLTVGNWIYIAATSIYFIFGIIHLIILLNILKQLKKNNNG